MAAKKVDVDFVFYALGDPTRRALLEAISEGPISVSQLAAPLDMSLAAVVQHLQVLERSGLVRTRKEGRVRTCEIDGRGLEAAEKWLKERRGGWERRLERLGELLGE